MTEQYQDMNNVPVSCLTADQLLGQIREIVAEEFDRRVKAITTPREVATSLGELARKLGCSVSTVQRIKKSGVIDKAVSQRGRTIIFDVAKVRELLLVANRGRKISAR